jgi:hypothetical protein
MKVLKVESSSKKGKVAVAGILSDIDISSSIDYGDIIDTLSDKGIKVDSDVEDSVYQMTESMLRGVFYDVFNDAGKLFTGYLRSNAKEWEEYVGDKVIRYYGRDANFPETLSDEELTTIDDVVVKYIVENFKDIYDEVVDI